MVSTMQLQDVQKYVPSDSRNLCACLDCKLIMTANQWERIKICPNCRSNVADNNVTSDFVGMISLMMPRESWVAKWNEIRTYIPGVYAINIPITGGDLDGGHEVGGISSNKRHKAKEDEDLDGFVVPDSTM